MAPAAAALAAEKKPAVSFRSAHRALHAAIALVVLLNEGGKALWSHWKNRGYGYWWVRLSGFSVEQQSSGVLTLVLTLLLLDLALTALGAAGAPRVAACLHGAAGLLLVALCAADLALFVGAGGARVSLPLVLFALSERQYAWAVARPWLHVLVASTVALVVCVGGLGVLLLWVVRRLAPSRRAPLTLKVGVLVACSSLLWAQKRSSDGINSDLLGQLGVDMVNLARGTLFIQSLSDALASHQVAHEEERRPTEPWPPLLLFHWEAGVDYLLRPLGGNRSSAAPFLSGLVQRGEALASTGTVTVPMTLKGAWEALCGTPPAMTPDFREQGSALRSECLPRVLARCCGYHSILAKNDAQLPDLPRRVFGFSEVVFASDNEELLTALRDRLAALRAEDARRPVLVYFYAGDSHGPYLPDRVSADERGYAEEPAKDVFLALHRRIDRLAERVAAFWPPRPAAGERWRPEHGLAIYFGDHGESLDDPDAPPHGNQVVPEVTRVLLAVENRAFAQWRRTRRPSLRRLADVFSTVASCVGLRARGRLHVGRSLLDSPGHEWTASFSFYRPSELAAVHLAPEPGDGALGEVRSQIFARDQEGWRPTVGGAGAAAPGSVRIEMLHEALAMREEANTLLTRSNIHSAWLMARLEAIAREARAALRAAAALILPALPAAR